jgi:DNA-binding MarR family transcriptional regulator
MHSLLFSLKRAQHSTLRISRPLLAKLGLTAARLDLLHALKDRRKSGLLQSHVQRVLGVTRATVSRMLGSLEELGLVRREKEPADRRQKRVWLTDDGYARLDAAYDRLVRSGWVRLAIDSTLGAHTFDGVYRRGPIARELAQLDRHLTALRRGCCDTGSLVYRPRAPRSARLSWP